MQEHDLPRTLVFHPGTRSVVYFGPFRLDLSDGLLTRNGEEVRLPPRALTILQHLVERAGRIVSKQSLMDVAWKDAHVSETSLTEAVGLIRQALGDDPQKPEFVQTVHRRGYRFIAAISTEPAADTAAGRSTLSVRAGGSHQRGCAFARGKARHDTSGRRRGPRRNDRAAGIGRILGVARSRSVSWGASGPRQCHVPAIGGTDSQRQRTPDSDGVA